MVLCIALVYIQNIFCHSEFLAFRPMALSSEWRKFCSSKRGVESRSGNNFGWSMPSSSWESRREKKEVSEITACWCTAQQTLTLPFIHACAVHNRYLNFFFWELTSRLKIVSTTGDEITLLRRVVGACIWTTGFGAFAIDRLYYYGPGTRFGASRPFDCKKRCFPAVLFWGTFVALNGFERLFFFFQLAWKTVDVWWCAPQALAQEKVQIGATFTLAGVASLSQSLRVSRLDQAELRKGDNQEEQFISRWRENASLDNS